MSNGTRAPNAGGGAGDDPSARPMLWDNAVAPFGMLRVEQISPRPLHPRAMRVLRIIGLVVGFGPAFGCGIAGPGQANAQGETEEVEEEQATPVVVGTVQAGPISASLSAASTIEAETQVTVHAESTGRIVRLEVEEGDEVEAGQLLARIKYDAQAAMLDRASTSLDKAETDLATVESLYERKVASKEELDAAKLAYKQALLDVQDRRRDIRNTKVLAPFSGVVTERFASTGAFVTSGSQLLTITDFSTLVARVYIPEKQLDRIAEGQPAVIVGKAARGRKGTGVVKRVAPVVDATTGTVKLTIGLPEDMVGGERGFLPGMYAEVTLTTEQRERATLLVKEAIIRDEDEPYVFVLEGDRVKRKPVELGLEDDKNAEVLSGVSVGEEVVIAGHAGLKDGGLIRRVDPSGAPVESAQADGQGIAGRTDAQREGA